jgi:hypothetical protein
LSVWGKEQIKSVDGARLGSDASLEETFPASESAGEAQRQTITLHFAPALSKSPKEEKSPRN